jgi:hypothetical protein
LNSGHKLRIELNFTNLRNTLKIPNFLGVLLNKVFGKFVVLCKH